MLMGLIEAVSQQISPKLKLLYKIPTSGAIDSALKGTLITRPPLIRILKDETRLWITPLLYMTEIYLLPSGGILPFMH